MWGLSSWVIILPSALNRVIAAWAGAPARPLARGPCKQMAAEEGQEGRNKQAQQAQPHPASLVQVTAGACVPSLRGVGAPFMVSLPIWPPRSGDSHRSPQPLLVLAPTASPCPSPQRPLTSFCGPSTTFLLQHAESFVLRKPKREKVVLLTLLFPPPPPPPVRPSAPCSCGLLNPHDHPCGRSDFQITVEIAGAVGG